MPKCLDEGCSLRFVQMIEAKKLIEAMEDIRKTLIYEGLSVSANMPPNLNPILLYSAVNTFKSGVIWRRQSGPSQTQMSLGQF